MKNIESLIKHYDSLGVKLWTDKDKLRFKAPVGSLTDEDKAVLRENKENIIAYLSEIENRAVTHKESDVYKPFTLTPIQSSYLLGRNSIYDYGGTGCHAYVEIKIEPACDLKKVENAWHRVIMRHDMLRAVIEKEGIQKVLEAPQLPEVRDFRVPDDEYDKLLESTRNEMSMKKYASDVYPLHELRVTSCSKFSILHFSMDMLIADSVSASIILSDILSFYYEPEKELPKPAISFRDVVIYDQSKKNIAKYSIKYDKDKAYWNERLDSIPPAPRLPVLANGKGRYEAGFEQMEFTLSNADWEKLKETAKQYKLTGSSVILAAFAEILADHSEYEHFCINTTTMSRPPIHEQIYDVVGDFTNIDLLEIDRDRNDTFAESAVKIQTRLWNDLEHSEFNGVEVMRTLSKKRKKQLTMPYVYTSTIGLKGMEDSRVNVVYKTSQTPQVFIDCQVSENKDGSSVIWSVRKNVFKNGVAEKMFVQLTSLINELVKDDTVWQKNFPCVGNNETDRDDMWVSKDGVHKNNEYVIGKIYDKNGSDTGVLGRYAPDGSIELLGDPNNSVEYKDNIVYLDRCEKLIKDRADIRDVYIGKNKGKADIYIIPKETSKKDELVFDNSSIENPISNNDYSTTLERETEASNELSALELIRLFQSEGIFVDMTVGVGLDEIKDKLNIKPEYSFLLKRWLNALCKDGYIKYSDGMYYVAVTDTVEKYEQLSREILQLMDKDNSVKKLAEYIYASKENLRDIISGSKSPLEVFFPEGSDDTAFSTYSEGIFVDSMNMAIAENVKRIIDSKNGRRLRILEVGAGVGGTTAGILKVLEDYPDTEYYFTDISGYFLKLAAKRFAKSNNVKYGIFDINKSCREQGMALGQFDIIIGANVFHNAQNGSSSMRYLKEMMSPNGYMIMLDAVEESYSLMISKSILHNEEILDSRAEEERIFFTHEQWKKIIDENDMTAVDIFPKSEILSKSQLKVYTICNKAAYADITQDNVFECVKDEAGFPEVFEHIVISQMLPVDSEAHIDADAIDQMLAESNLEDKNTKSEKSAPTNDTERKILEIWTDILENNSLGIDDNFFEVGGDSLLASMMITNLRRDIPEAAEIEWEKLMQMVLQNPTVRDIANVILKTLKNSCDFCLEYQHGSDDPERVWVLFVNGTGTMAIYNSLVQNIKEKISSDDRIIGLHFGDFNDFIKLPMDKTINILAEKSTDLLAKINAKRYELIGHCYGGGVAIQTAIELGRRNINNVSVTTIDTRRWNVFCDNSLIIERGFGEMNGSDVSNCGHTVSDDILQKNLAGYIEKHGRLMNVDELCNDIEIDKQVRDCYSKLVNIPQDERLRMMFRYTENAQTAEQEEQFILLYKVFYQCLVSFSTFSPKCYSGKVRAIRCNDRSNFFIPVENADESDYIKEVVTGEIEDYFIDGDHFTCLLDKNNAKIVSEIVLKNMVLG